MSRRRSFTYISERPASSSSDFEFRYSRGRSLSRPPSPAPSYKDYDDYDYEYRYEDERDMPFRLDLEVPFVPFRTCSFPRIDPRYSFVRERSEERRTYVRVRGKKGKERGSSSSSGSSSREKDEGLSRDGGRLVREIQDNLYDLYHSLDTKIILEPQRHRGKTWWQATMDFDERERDRYGDRRRVKTHTYTSSWKSEQEDALRELRNWTEGWMKDRTDSKERRRDRDICETRTERVKKEVRFARDC